MKILLDTKVIYDALFEPSNLNEMVKTILTDETNILFISPLSEWKMDNDAKLGKTRVDGKMLHDASVAFGLTALPLTSEALVEYRKISCVIDPNDHAEINLVLLGQAIENDCLFLTYDGNLVKVPGSKIIAA